jgi:DNA-binding MarR family transcriptional regulator
LARVGGRTARRAAESVERAAGLLSRAMRPVCVAHGLTLDQYAVLRALGRAGLEGLPRFALATRLAARAPDATRLIDRLERAGLVERTRSERDRRRSVSRLTDAGRARLAAVEAGVRAACREVLAPLGRRQVRTLTRLCRSLDPPG